MKNKRSYLDSINAGRRRRPNPSFQDMDRTLAQLEGRVERVRDSQRDLRDDYPAPRRAERQRYRDDDFQQPEQYDRYEAAPGATLSMRWPATWAARASRKTALAR